MSLPYYKRYPRDLFEGTVGMTVELKGAYSLLIDLIMLHDDDLHDDSGYISGQLGCTKNKWAVLKKKLIALGKISDTGGTINSHQMISRQRRRSLSPLVRLLILERDWWTCTYCDSCQGPFHIDHIYPVSLGGSDDPDNLCCACAPCNLSKSNKTIAQWKGVANV